MGSVVWEEGDPGGSEWDVSMSKEDQVGKGWK